MERIIGIGIDQVEIQRVMDACKRERFVKKTYSEKRENNKRCMICEYFVNP